MNNLRALFPTKIISSAPPALSNMNWWFRGDSVIVSGTTVTTWLDRTHSGNNTTTSGAAVTWVQIDGSVNSQSSLQFTDSGHFVLGNSTTAYFDPTLPFTWSGIMRVNQALTSGNFAEVATFAGTTAANSATLIIYNNPTPGNVVLQLQTGNGSTTIAYELDPTYLSYTTYVITYNGAGTGTAANYQFVINGTNNTPTVMSASGGDVASNTIAGSSGLSGDVSSMAESATWNIVLSSGQLTQLNNYYMSRYGI